MFRISSALFSFLFAIMVLASVYPVEATTMSFTVHGGEEVTESLNLGIEDHVTIIITVGELGGNTIDFYITYPNKTVKEFGKVSFLDYRFICNVKGEYTLNFSNEGSFQDRLVTLNYEVQRYVFGVPQTLFLTMIIAAVCVAAVAAFILMGKHH